MKISLPIDVQCMITKYLPDRELHRIKLLKLFSLYAIHRAEKLSLSSELLHQYWKRALWLEIMQAAHAFLKVTVKYRSYPIMLASTPLETHVKYKDKIYKYITVHQISGKVKFGLISMGIKPMLDIDTWFDNIDDIEILDGSKTPYARTWKMLYNTG